MSHVNHKRTESSLAPLIFYVAKNWQLKDRRIPIGDNPPSSFAEMSLEHKHSQSSKNILVYKLNKVDLHLLCDKMEKMELFKMSR